MKSAVYISNKIDPYSNLAFEEVLCRSCREDLTLLLWQNNDTVVIGRNQNAWSECNLPAMKEDGIRLARRTTGGGAVFHDMGNLNFSVIFPSAVMDKSIGYGIIQRALKNLGIESVLSGRNDLTTADGKKFSGNAFRLENGVFLHHGTLLITSVTERMDKYLNPSFEKLKAKGIKSVHARVTSLSDLNGSLTVERLQEELTNVMKTDYAGTLCECDWENGLISEIEKSLSDPGWIYGRSGKADVTFSRRFEFGSLDLMIMTSGNQISGVKVYTDALETDISERLENILMGCSFVPGGLSEKTAGSDIPHKEEISKWLKEMSL